MHVDIIPLISLGENHQTSWCICTFFLLFQHFYLKLMLFFCCCFWRIILFIDPLIVYIRLTFCRFQTCSRHINDVTAATKTRSSSCEDDPRPLEGSSVEHQGPGLGPGAVLHQSCCGSSGFSVGSLIRLISIHMSQKIDERNTLERSAVLFWQLSTTKPLGQSSGIYPQCGTKHPHKLLLLLLLSRWSSAE